MSAFKILGRLVSKADQALDTIKREKGTGAEFLRELEKTPGVKQAELKERGIDKALKSKPKMTKAEVRKVLEENPPPKLKEQVHGGNEYQEALDNKAKEIVGDRDATFDDLYGRDREMARDAVESELGFNPETRHEKWRTPGGENYREILLKLPKRGLNEAEQRILMNYEADVRRGTQLDPWHQSQYDALKAKEAMGKQDFYHEQHWGDTPNVLAHIRVQDFKTPDGKKVLLVDEIQSDWHQAAHQERQKEIKRLMKERGIDKKQASALVPENKGYAQPETSRMTGTVVDAGDGTYRVEWPDGTFSGGYNQEGAMQKALEGKSNAEPGVPDAPFKKNWHELAMKRVLDYAADKGYDTVAITPGAEQAKRYDLSKQIDQIKYIQNSDGTYDLSVRPVGQARDTMFIGDKSLTGLKEDEIEGLVGKELAQKIVSKEGPEGGDRYRTLAGVDLQVGGEGMKGFYDQILPTYLNNLGKQYGAQVKTYNLPQPPRDSTLTFGYPGAEEYVGGRITWGDFLSRNPRAAEEFFTPVHSFDITPQMREEIKAKGLPLYGKIALPEAGTLAAGSGAATIGLQTPEQPLPPQMYAQPEYRRGGQVKRKVKFSNNPDTMRLELMSGKR